MSAIEQYLIQKAFEEILETQEGRRFDNQVAKWRVAIWLEV